MPIRPIDIVTMAPKSQEASNVHQHENHRAFHDHAQIGAQFNNQVLQNNKQTTRMEKSENKEYRYDARKQGSGSDQGEKKGKKQKDKKDQREDIKTSSFDIKI